MSSKVIFDVGANDGSSCLSFSYEPNTIVYAFEPSPFLVKELRKHEKENYIVVPNAVSNYAGKIKFNLASEPQVNSGVGSILPFSENLHVTWPGYHYFYTTDVIEVDCITMKSFIEENKIKNIDYLHCDTQGSDLDVLESFGDYIELLQAGQIEAYGKNPAYKGARNSVSSCADFLRSNGFSITEVISCDHLGNEFNMRFSRVTPRG